MTATETSFNRLTVRCESCGSWNRIRSDRASDGPKCGKCAAPIRLDHPIVLDDDTFDRTVNESDVPVLVDFYADWCGPCKMMAPYVEQLAREQVGRAIIAKVDTERSQRTAGRFSIRGIPTTIVFRNGREANRQVGAVPKERLAALLQP